MPAKRDKTTGLPLPTPVTPATNLCVQLSIPNAPEYVQAFRGVLAELGKFWTWSRTVGQSDDDANEAAELWRDRLQYITYSEDCEDPVSCADVAMCFSTSGAVQDALTSAVINSAPINSYFNAITNIGTPMLPAAAAANLTGDAACDLDALFGSITAIVTQLNTNNIDFLEQLEIESNTIERVSALFAAIPIFETLPVDDTLSYIDTLMGEIKENYEATVTTALIDEYRCGLFCLARDNPECEVSFDMLIGYFENRLSVSFEPETIFLNFVEYFSAGSWSGTQIVDVMMLGQLAIWRAASNFLGLSLRTLQVVGALGANDEDPDWEILCTDCPSNWCYDMDFKTSDYSAQGVTPNIDIPGITLTGFTWVNGVGLVTSGATDADKTFGQINFPEETVITGATLKWEYVDPPTSGNIWMDQDFGSAHPVSPPTVFFQVGASVPVTRYVFGGEHAGADVTPFIVITGLTLTGPNPIPEQFGSSNC